MTQFAALGSELCNRGLHLIEPQLHGGFRQCGECLSASQKARLAETPSAIKRQRAVAHSARIRGIPHGHKKEHYDDFDRNKQIIVAPAEVEAINEALRQEYPGYRFTGDSVVHQMDPEDWYDHGGEWEPEPDTSRPIYTRRQGAARARILRRRAAVDGYWREAWENHQARKLKARRSMQ